MNNSFAIVKQIVHGYFVWIHEQFVIMAGIGTRLRSRARDLGFSDAEVARRSGLSAERYGNYVRDRREPDFETLAAICRALDTSPNYLFGFSDTRAVMGPRYDFDDDFSFIPVRDVRVAAGYGGFREGEDERERIAFRRQWLRSITNTPEAELSVIEVVGDSMVPTLQNGDHILVDHQQTVPNRDGLYVFRRGDDLQVKRVSLNPENNLLTVRSDNPAFESWENVDPSKIRIAGRVLWIGRRV